MALELTQTAKNLSEQVSKEPIIILEIDGLSLKFGSGDITRKWFLDEGYFFDDGLQFDGEIIEPNARSFIQERGTTNNLTNQIEIEDGGSGSIQKFNISMIDQNNEVSNILTPSVELKDPLSTKADVYLNFKGGSHPEDSARIFTGIIDAVKVGAGNVNLTIAHPDQLKRQDLFQINDSKLDGAISDSDTTITFKDNSLDQLEPTSEFLTYIRINDEIIQYTGVSGNQLTGCSRGQLNTIATSHANDSEFNSYYVLVGDPIDIALKLMISGSEEIASGSIENFNQLTATEYRENAILINDRFFLENNGIVNGESITISGATEIGNNITATILDSSVIDSGTVMVLDQALTDEQMSGATFTMKSQYDVLPDGCGMTHAQVDVQQHLTIKEQYGNQLPDYEIQIKDTIVGKEFLVEQVYLPAGLYSVIRKARSSVQITAAPLGVQSEFNETNIKNPDKIVPERSINKYFYNNVTYRYGVDSIEDKYLRGQIRLSNRSTNRIKYGNKALTITSDGLVDNASTEQFITRQSRRFTERFQFAADKIKIETLFKDGYPVEVGDPVLFNGSELKVYDVTDGSRNFRPRIMEVINKSLSIFKASVTLELLDTQFASNSRYGSVSPNSYIDSGSTTTSIKIKKSFSTGEFDIERDKWSAFIGEKIRVRNKDFTFTEDVILLSFDSQDETRINISEISIAPSEDYLLDLPRYDNGDAKMKTLHCFATPRISITGGISNTEFTVDPSDIDKFYVGGVVRVHNKEFTVDSTPTLDNDDLEIIDITGNNIIVDRDMGFTPSSNEFASLVGFSSDKGAPYRFA